VVLHASGSPNSTVDSADPGRCLSFAQAKARGIDVEQLREDFTASIDVFPGHQPEIAEAWTELQHEIRDQLEASTVDGLGGNAMFSIFFFEPDGRIVRVIHRGLEPGQAEALCKIVDSLTEQYRFPLQSEVRFSQCGTTHFAEK
jgi:hypothetical protein